MLRVKEMTDRDLVVLAQQGRIDGFTELAGRYYPALLAIAQSVLGDKHLAEDAAQESLAKACSMLRGLRDPERFGCWLAKICRNTSVSMVRGRANLRFVEDLPDRPVHEERAEDLEWVRKVVRGLPAKYREVIYLRYYDGMTYERISTVLGLSVQALNGRLRRAKDLIRSQLQGKLPLED